MDTSSIPSYCHRLVGDLFSDLGSSPSGLDAATAKTRLEEHGPNTPLSAQQGYRNLRLFLERFESPLILILLFAAGIALVVHELLDAAIIMAIVLISALLSFVQESRANRALERLRQQVAVRCLALRDGAPVSLPVEDVVPGDLVKLAAGSLVPADGVLIEANELFVSQALLTGETFPVEKRPGPVPAESSLAEQTNCVFMGTSVRSGTGTAIIVRTGGATHYGEIAHTLSLRPPETDFERGLKHFGNLLVRVMVVMVLGVLAVNILLEHATLDMFLFAMALAVGLSPELLPAILSITLARGARAMAAQGVVVKHLNAIENLGSMNVLCTDKTGTLTQGVVQLDGTPDCSGEPAPDVLRLAWLNACFQSGIDNPLDAAVVAAGRTAGLETGDDMKLVEIPYDFVRKRLSVVVGASTGRAARMITKGALQNVLDICDKVRSGDSLRELDASVRADIEARFLEWSRDGYRVLGVAEKEVEGGRSVSREDEQQMTFRGFLLFFDPPEREVRKTLARLRRLGVRVKIITGDNRHVARHVADAVGLSAHRVITGSQLAAMGDEALWHLAPRINLFAEVDPAQKERIILALQKAGNVVGYLGDGINDAPALHAADVGVSVDQAVDVAKDAADIVLLEHGLEVLCQGINQGRHTFANTIKYIYITTSANFGNMISMAVGTLFLPFLPLLAKQILLNNLLSDIPAIGIAGDNVDRDWERTPHRWDVGLVRNFMITFGLISTVFDLLTFGVLLYLAGAVAEIFRTGWFIESLLTEVLIVFVIRTHKPVWQSRTGPLLLWTTCAVIVFTLLLPYLPIAVLFGFVPLPPAIIGAILLIAVAYLMVSEFGKRIFFRRFAKTGRIMRSAKGYYPPNPL